MTTYPSDSDGSFVSVSGPNGDGSVSCFCHIVDVFAN